jgi:hypothetical protein
LGRDEEAGGGRRRVAKGEARHIRAGRRRPKRRKGGKSG